MSSLNLANKVTYFRDSFCRTIKPIMLKNGFTKLSNYTLEPKGIFTAEQLLDLIEAITDPIEDLVKDIKQCMAKLFKQVGSDGIDEINNTLGAMAKDYDNLLGKLDCIYNVVNDDDSDIKYRVQTLLAGGGIWFNAYIDICLKDIDFQRPLFYIDFDEKNNAFVLKQRPDDDGLSYTIDVGSCLSVEYGNLKQRTPSADEEPTPISEYVNFVKEAEAHERRLIKQQYKSSLDMNQIYRNEFKGLANPFTRPDLNVEYTCLCCGKRYKIGIYCANEMIESKDFTRTRICSECVFFSWHSTELDSKEKREEYIKKTLPKLTLVDEIEK